MKRTEEALVIWVRFLGRTTDQEEELTLPVNSNVSNLRAAIIAKFPKTLKEPTDIESLNIGEQALTSNRTKLATIPIQDTVVIKKN